MREIEFENYLLDDVNITSKVKAVGTRMSKARAVEKMLGVSLDTVVLDDNKMREALLKVNENLSNRSGAYSNSLRKYYTFVTGNTFPRL